MANSLSRDCVIHSVNASSRSFTAGSVSRAANGGRLNRDSKNFGMETVSYSLCSTLPWRANGEMMMAGTRTPVPQPSFRTGGAT